MDKTTTMIVIGLVVVLLFFSPEATAKRRQYVTTSRPATAPWPIPGPSPMGTSWAQNGPAPYTSQTNGYDVGVSAINAFGSTLVGLANAGVFSSDDDISGGYDDTYSTSYVDSLADY
jgi:hypothetical protein